MAKSIYDDYADLPVNLLEEVKREAEANRLKAESVKKILDRVRHSFESSKISPGESIGIVTAESIGEPGTQMSLVAEEKLQIKANNEFNTVEIGKFVDEIISTYGCFINGLSEIADIPSELKIHVPSLNKNGEILVGEVSQVSRHRFSGKLVKLTTKSGKKITATPFHSFIIKNSDGIAVVSSKDLRIGEKLPVLEEHISHNFRNINLRHNNSQLLILGKALWEEIKSIDFIDVEDDYVYDLSVPGLETFTTAEGIITHNTLNVFHFAGVAEVAVTLGLPRLIELLDARKEPSTPKIEVYLEREISKDPGKVKRVAASIRETKLGEVVDEFSVNMSQSRVEIYVNKTKMRDFAITENQLVKMISDSLKNVDVRANKDFISIKLKTEQFELKELYQLREKAREMHIKGVKGIRQVLPIKRDNEFVIVCVGNSYGDIMNIDGVDFRRTVTNDIFLTCSILGIEAARQAIMNESIEVIESQGLDIDIRHIMLLADVMTSMGAIKGITRSGITGEKESVLARASFETPIKHIVNATLKGEEDRLNSVIENVMLNQEIPVGTGLPSLIAKVKK